MTMLDLLRQCKKDNITLSESNGKLIVNAPEGSLNTELRESIEALENQLLASLSIRKDVISTSVSVSTFEQTEEKPTLLSEYQLPIWASYEQEGKHSSMLTLAESFELDRRVTSDELQAAFLWIADRHSMLRAQFQAFSDQNVKQRILPEVPVTVILKNIKKIDESPSEAARMMLSSVMTAPYNLEQDVLFRVGLINSDSGNSTVVISISHIIGDIASLQVIVRELECYLDYLDGLKPLPENRPPQYTDCLRAVKKLTSENEKKQGLAYWRSQLQHLAPVHNLPTDFKRLVNRKTTSIDSVAIQLPSASDINNKLTEKGISMFAYLLTTLKLTLSHFGGAHELPVITPMANRHHHSMLEDTVGCFANEVVLNVSVNDNDTLNKTLSTVKNALAEVLDYQGIPFSEVLQQTCSTRTPDWLPIAQIFFSYLDYSENRRAKHRFESIRTLEYDLSFLLIQGQDSLNLTVGFDTSLYKKETVKLIADIFRRNYSIIAKNLDSAPAVLSLNVHDSPDMPVETLDQMDQIIQTCKNKTVFFFQDESIPVIETLKERLKAAGTTYHVLDSEHHPEMNDNSVVFTTGSIERLDSIATNTLESTPFVCMVNHLPSAAMLQRIAQMQKDGCILLEIQGSNKEKVNYIHIPFAKLKSLQDHELFVCSTTDSDLSTNVPGEMIQLNNGLQAIYLGNTNLKLPLPDTTTTHVWRNGAFLNLDALSATRSQETGQAVALALIPSPLQGDTSDKLVEWIAPSSSNWKSAIATSPVKTLQPDYQVSLSAIPLSPAGKIDRHALSLLPLMSQALLDTVQAALIADGQKDIQLTLGKNPPTDRQLHHSEIISKTESVFIGGRYSTLDMSSMKKDTGKTQRISEEHGPVLTDKKPTSFHYYIEQFADQELVFIDIKGTVTVVKGSAFHKRALALLSALQNKGIKSGSRVILHCGKEEEILCLAWACVMGGIGMTALLPPMEGQNPEPLHTRLGHLYEILERPPLLTSEGLELPFEPDQRYFYNELEKEGKQIGTTPELFTTKPDTIVYTAFTSGSTGTPKGVPLTAHNLFSMIHAKSKALGAIENETMLSMTALDHVASLFGHSFLATIRKARQVYCPFQYILADPLRVLDIIDTYQVAQTWAPDFTWRHLHESLRRNDVKDRQWNLASVRYLISGGESTREATFINLERSLASYNIPSGVFFHSWGMSETSSFFTFSQPWDGKSHASHLGIIDAGKPLYGLKTRVANQHGTVLPEGSIGSLQVSGPTVFSAYLNNPKANAESSTNDGWFITGDLAIMNKGRMILCGREKEQVVIKGENISQFDIEGMVDGIDGVEPTFSVVVGCKNYTTGDDDVLIFARTQLTAPEEKAALIKRINAETSSHYGVMPSHVLLVDEQSVPKAALGKIQRTKILKKFIKGGFAKELCEADLLLQGKGTVPDWFVARQWTPVQTSAADTARIDSFANNDFFFTAGSSTLLADEVTTLLQHHGATIHTFSSAKKPSKVPSCSEDQGTLLFFLEPEESSATENKTSWITNSFAPLCTLISSLEQGTIPLSELIVVTSSALAINQQDSYKPWSTALIGLLSSLPRAINIKTRLVDVEGLSIASDAHAVLSEIYSAKSEDVSVWRNGERYASLLRKVKFSQNHTATSWDTPFRGNKLCLCTGMTGHLGAQLLPQLLLKTNGNFLLTGRSDAQKITHTLETLCSEIPKWNKRVLYHQTDLTDAASINDALEKAISFFSTQKEAPVLPGGILHLAADTREHTFKDLKAEELVEAMQMRASHFDALEKAFVHCGGSGPRIAFSSVVSHWGGSGSAQYAPSCAFVESMVHNYNAFATTKNNRWHCFAWSRWQGSADTEEAISSIMKTRGFLPITPEQGLLSMVAMLRYSVSNGGGLLFAGVDSSAPDISGRLRTPGHKVSTTHSIELSSPYNNISFLRKQCEETIGRNVSIRMASTGKNADKSSNSQKKVHPLGGKAAKVERTMTTIWCDVLQLNHVEPTANFFELGGTSIHVPRLRKKIQDTLNVDVGSVGVFHFPCVQDMAQAVAEKLSTKKADSTEVQKTEADLRAEKQRKARAARR